MSPTVGIAPRISCQSVSDISITEKSCDRFGETQKCEKPDKKIEEAKKTKIKINTQMGKPNKKNNNKYQKESSELGG